MDGKAAELTEGHAAPRIIMMRGQKVVLDSDLARLYGVETFRFNEAVKRNRNRFPPDFAFQLTHQEFSSLISQIAISSSGDHGDRPVIGKQEKGIEHRTVNIQLPTSNDKANKVPVGTVLVVTGEEV